MKKLFAGLALVLTVSNVQAEPLFVEFISCSANANYVCALVYGKYNAQEMAVTAATYDINSKINESILSYGRSLSMSIEGTVSKSTSYDGQENFQLYVSSLENSSSTRPR